MQKQPETAWLFDVDGVLADPKHKQIDNEFYDIILHKLKKGEPVGLNTGRSTTWMEDKIVKPLLDRISDTNILKHFLAVGEKGGTWMTVDENGQTHKQKSERLYIDKDMQKKVKDLINEKYSDVVELDPTKETMISIEMKDGYDVATFAERQKELNKDLGKILENAQDAKNYKLDPTTIATDIENPDAGKALGTARFLEWLDEHSIEPQKFIAFGDSVSDLEMADELKKRGKEVTFVYVGDPKKLKEAEKEGKVKNKAIIEEIGDFTQGTLRYLSK